MFSLCSRVFVCDRGMDWFVFDRRIKNAKADPGSAHWTPLLSPFDNFKFVFVNFDCIKRIYLNCSQRTMLTI